MRTIMFLLVTLTIFNVHAQDAKKGAELFKKCAACHGKNGEGMKATSAPKIAGQHDWYLLSSLKAYQSGTRNVPTMTAMVKPMSEQDFKDVAAYVSSLK